jgi:hypothetical protein
MLKRVIGPEIGKEEGNWSLEIVGIKEKRPAIPSRRYILSIGFILWLNEGKVEITIAEQFPLRSILYSQTVYREKEAIAELGNAIYTAWFIPFFPFRERDRWLSRKNLVPTPPIINFGVSIGNLVSLHQPSPPSTSEYTGESWANIHVPGNPDWKLCPG